MRRGKDLIVVTGATGQQGGAVARELLGAGHRVRAMTRKPQGEAARALATLGADVVRGDLDDPTSLPRALQGAWGTFAVQSSTPQWARPTAAPGFRTSTTSYASSSGCGGWGSPRG